MFVVVRPEQVEPYEQLVKRLKLDGATILPIGKEGIANTRNAIVQHAGPNKFCMIDDDLGFLKRRDDHVWKLRGSEHIEMVRMFVEIEEQLNDFAHVAISCREGNNRIETDYADTTRGIRLVGYDGSVLAHLGLGYDPSLEGREDLDMTLRLLRLGYSNRVLYNYAQGQKGSDTNGGLNGSDARKDEEMERTAKLLEERHPGFVKARTKTTKTSWGGKTRWDVICYWKKAFASSQPEEQ